MENQEKKETVALLGVEKNPTEKPLGFALPAHGGYINIPNPFRSILVIGGAGAGKTASVVEPIIFQAMRKKFTGFVYDFNYPTLGNVVYSSLLYHENTTPNEEKIKFFPVSFTDLGRSCRFNPLDPGLLSSSTQAEEYSWALYCNLDKEAIKKGGFFPESAAGLLKSVIWFMKKNHPDHCTLPHVINIILNADTKTLVNMIVSDVETKGMVKSVKEAAEKEAYDQLAGVVGSLTMQLQKINTPEICWVLTGNDFTLDLNNPSDPKFIVLGSLPEFKSTLNPVIAFISAIALKLMNAQDKLQSIALIDEGPTLFIPNLDSLPATGRSNKLSVVYVAQSFSQMDVMYGKESRRALVGNLAYQFYGNTSDLETAKQASDVTGVEVQEMLTLKQGTFVGKLVESENDLFKAPLKRIIDSNKDFKITEIPIIDKKFTLTDEEEKKYSKTLETYLSSKKEKYLSDNFNKIQEDVKQILANYSAS